MRRLQIFYFFRRNRGKIGLNFLIFLVKFRENPLQTDTSVQRHLLNRIEKSLTHSTTVVSFYTPFSGGIEMVYRERDQWNEMSQ